MAAGGWALAPGAGRGHCLSPAAALGSCSANPVLASRGVCVRAERGRLEALWRASGRAAWEVWGLRALCLLLSTSLNDTEIKPC